MTPDPTEVPPDEFSADDTNGSAVDAAGDLEEDDLEPFREMPAGTNDPNIVGAADTLEIPLPDASADNEASDDLV